MHFPFLSLLPCPPNAQGPNKRCEVRSCPKCFSVLEDVWALYRACQARAHHLSAGLPGQVPPGLLCLGPYSLEAAFVGPGQPSIDLLHLWG